MEPQPSQSFLSRHEFLIRRLHSLTGLIPVGAFMTAHLLVNASILGSAGLFQQNVYRIHNAGPLLPMIEWTFIFLPLIFHAVIGVVIVKGGSPNNSTYAYSGNIRYSLQRVSGLIAFVFILWHVFHMHGWLHADWWVNSVATPLGGSSFRPYSAASTAAQAMQQSFLVPLCYVIGVLACVYHLANGLWTMGITWGLWVSPAAQRRANWVAICVGVAMSILGVGSVVGFWAMDDVAMDEARQVEDKMYEAKVAGGEIDGDEHKRAGHGPASAPNGGDEMEETTTADAASDRLANQKTMPVSGQADTEAR